MKIKKADILIFIIFLIILISCHFTWILNKADNVLDSYYIIILSILAFIITYLLSNGGILKYAGRFVNTFVVVVILLTFLEAVYTCYYTDKDFLYCFNQIVIYFSVILIYPLMYVLYSKCENNLRHILVVCELIMLGYCSYIAWIFNTTKNVVNENFIPLKEWVRNGSIRIGSIPLMWFALLIEVTFLFICKSKIKKSIHLLISAVVVWFIFTINQSRAYEMVVLIMFGAMYFFYTRQPKKKIIKSMLVFLLLLIIVATGVFDRLILSISEGQEEQNMYVRIRFLLGINSVITKLPLGYLLGCGAGSTVDIHGFTYNFIDIGFLGDFFNFGIISIVIYGLIIVRLFNNIKYTKRINSNYFIFNIGAFAFILSGMIGFSVLPISRFIVVPFLIAYTEYSRKSENFDLN